MFCLCVRLNLFVIFWHIYKSDIHLYKIHFDLHLRYTYKNMNCIFIFSNLWLLLHLFIIFLLYCNEAHYHTEIPSDHSCSEQAPYCLHLRLMTLALPVSETWCTAVPSKCCCFFTWKHTESNQVQQRVYWKLKKIYSPIFLPVIGLMSKCVI